MSVVSTPLHTDAATGNGRVDLLGAPLDPLTMEQALQLIERAIERRTPVQHAALNAAKLVRLQRDELLADAIRGCELVTADGQPVVWAARLLGHRVPERVAGIDLMEALLARAAERGYRIYLFGARPQVVTEARAEIARRYPRIVVAGWQHGYYAPAEEPLVLAAIEAARPDILFIALETPQKELFLRQHGAALRVPFAMGVGGAFDVLAGRRKRAPRWAQDAGLEWFFRFAQEPRRLGRRYLVTNLQFLLAVGAEFLRSRIGRSTATSRGSRGRDS